MPGFYCDSLPIIIYQVKKRQLDARPNQLFVQLFAFITVMQLEKDYRLVLKELVVYAQAKGNPFTRSEAFELATLLLRRNAMSQLLFELKLNQITDLCTRITSDFDWS